MTGDRVEREPVPVLFVAVEGPPDEAAQPAFKRLEEALPSMQGRRFYGSFDPTKMRYTAYVEREEDDDTRALGLEEGELPGGAYLRARLRADPPELYGQIGPTFDALASEAGDAADSSRPWLEFYRSQNEVDVLVPVTQ
jgi:hypothetical protein